MITNNFHIDCHQSGGYSAAFTEIWYRVIVNCRWCVWMISSRRSERQLSKKKGYTWCGLVECNRIDRWKYIGTSLPASSSASFSCCVPSPSTSFVLPSPYRRVILPALEKGFQHDPFVNNLVPLLTRNIAVAAGLYFWKSPLIHPPLRKIFKFLTRNSLQLTTIHRGKWIIN